jgi:hypothetical protein
VLALATAFAASAPLSSAAPEPPPYAGEINPTDALTYHLLEAISGLCPLGTEDEFLTIIQTRTAGKELPVVAESLRQLGYEVGLRG